MLRAGAASNDLPVLARLVMENPLRSARCMVVSDDLTPTAILRDGYMDAKMRAMCGLGIDPLVALRMVTLTPAEYFGLRRRGGIAPGWLADMVLVAQQLGQIHGRGVIERCLSHDPAQERIGIDAGIRLFLALG